jgi:hypothetical protein
MIRRSIPLARKKRRLWPAAAIQPRKMRIVATNLYDALNKVCLAVYNRPMHHQAPLGLTLDDLFAHMKNDGMGAVEPHQVVRLATGKVEVTWIQKEPRISKKIAAAIQAGN